MTSHEPIRTEMQIAMALAYHLDNPCSDGNNNLRGMWLETARTTLPDLNNPFAIELISEKIRQYA
jgi:hypothetical protein